MAEKKRLQSFPNWVFIRQECINGIHSRHPKYYVYYDINEMYWHWPDTCPSTLLHQYYPTLVQSADIHYRYIIIESVGWRPQSSLTFSILLFLYTTIICLSVAFHVPHVKHVLLYCLCCLTGIISGTMWLRNNGCH